MATDRAMPATATGTTAGPATTAAVHNDDTTLPDAGAEEEDAGAVAPRPPRQTTTTIPTAAPAPGGPLPTAAAEPAPAPPPPTPGPRARRLQDLFDSSLGHTLAKISWDNFAACYPTAAASSSSSSSSSSSAAKPAAPLRLIHRAMVDRLRELCRSEFALVLRNRDVVAKLNELEALAAAAEARRRAAANGKLAHVPAPPHTLPPETVLAAHLAAPRRARREQLQTRLAAAQAANAERYARLAQQQAEMEQLMAALERALADVQGAAALLTTTGEAQPGDGHDGHDHGGIVAELARETRAADLDMAGV